MVMRNVCIASGTGEAGKECRRSAGLTCPVIEEDVNVVFSLCAV